MKKKGFILIEACMVTLILTTGLIAILPMLMLSIKANQNLERIKIATGLSLELIEEVKLRKWDETTPERSKKVESPSKIGVDDGESLKDKRTFDDIDDFDGWTENPPLDPVMNEIQDLSYYSREVTVRYLTNRLTAGLDPTDLKQIKVCTRSKTAKLKPICLDAIVANR